MSIAFKDIVSLTGNPGLYRIVKADDKAIIVESLDEKKRRTMVKGNMMVSKLTDVSIYTDEESEALLELGVAGGVDERVEAGVGHRQCVTAPP